MAIRTDFASEEVLDAADLNDTFASKPTFAYGTATPSTTVEGFLWYDENLTPPIVKFWEGSAFQTMNANAPFIINAQTGTSYTFVLADQGKLITAANASPITITVPPNSSVAFPVGTQIHVIQTGAGQVTFAQGSGVTINSFNSEKKIEGNGGMAVCIKTATDTWQLAGLLAA